MAKSFLMLGGCLFLLLNFPHPAQADEGKELFEKRCSSCHTIGGGDSAGPDLEGVTSRRASDWLVRLITEPDRLSAAKDPTQTALVKKYGMEMPNLGVSRDDALKIVAFLGGAPAAPSAKEEKGEKEEAPAAAPVAVTPALLARGRALFTGQVRFAKGGAPCVSCHELRYPGVQGGSLAADLTDLYGRMGESGVRGVLASLSFPVMKRIYAERPLNQEETEPLVALFKDASARRQPACRVYPYSGLGVFALCLVAAIVIRRRIK